MNARQSGPAPSQSVVMVVEDDDDLRETVCDLLEDHGYATLRLRRAALALAQLQAGRVRPDIILLDLMMPGMSGWEFRKLQLDDPDISRIPVVVMTASRDAHDIDANAIVYKPLTVVQLLDAVKRHGVAPHRAVS